ncbi:MAG: NUDIX hydrolase [Candidatus Micrarchaeota archaeon]|nr:NUDIX hydrolase [Candidatus Micrarchaeota archaeon]
MGAKDSFVKRIGERNLYSNASGSKKLVETIDIVDGKEITKSFIIEGDSATIIAMPTDDEVLMIRNYRAAGNKDGSVDDAFSYELPSGHVNSGELPEQAASRELEEETGFVAKSIEPLMSHYIGLYLTTCKDFVFLAKGLERSAARLEADEAITCESVKVGDLSKMLENGTIKDASSRDALLHWLMFGR